MSPQLVLKLTRQLNEVNAKMALLEVERSRLRRMIAAAQRECHDVKPSGTCSVPPLE